MRKRGAEDESDAGPAAADGDVEARALRNARRAYERGRLKVAARVSLYVLPVVAACALVSGAAGPVLLVGGSASAIAIFCFWRGGSLQQSVAAGFIGGFQTWGFACAGDACATFCAAAALVGGIAAVCVARHLARAAPPTPPSPHALPMRDSMTAQLNQARTIDLAGVLALMLGLLGALVAGSASVLGFVAGAAATCVVGAVAFRRVSACR
jgi:hypothetical protein